MRGQKTDIPLSQVNWRALRSLIPYLLEFRVHLILAVSCLVGAKLTSVGLPFVLKHIVDHLDQSYGPLLTLPLGLLLAYGSVRLANVLFGELRDTLFGRITERAMRRVGLKVFRHIHSLDLDFHLNRKTGGVARDIERGVNGISFLMRFMVFNIVPTLLEIALVIGLLLTHYNYGFAMIVTAAIICYVAWSVVATEWRTRYIREVNSAESATSSRAVDSLMNYETVKYFTNETWEADLYDRELATWEQARRKNRLTLFALNGGQAFVIAASMSGAMILAAWQVTQQQMTLGDFVLINAFMMQIFLPLNLLGFVYREMKGSIANIENMFGLLQQQTQTPDKENAQELVVSDADIEFRNVSFHYQPERPIIRDISFNIQKGQKVAVVGSSGAGKSTLFKLLFRFYDCTSGAIFIDGQNIRDCTQQSLRRQIGVVPQDTVLFNTSILENIRYGRIEADDTEVMHAIRLAHLEELVNSLPEGVHTLVGERGLKLSGGEKQRVAIARTILKRPPILIFDEATSSLDSKSEARILQALDELSQQQTSLAIAHRLSTVVNADIILVLDKGTIVEQGSHTHLLALGGKYAQLWHMQHSR